MKIQLVVAAAFSLIASSAAAQQLQALDFEGIPSVFFDKEGKVDSCGLRFYALDAESAPEKFLSADVSVMLNVSGFAKGVALVKGYSAEVSVESASRGNMKPKPVNVRDAWVRAPGAERTIAVDGKYSHSEESPTAVLYLSNVSPVMSVIDAALGGRQIQVSVKRQGSKINPVYYGTVKMPDKDRTQFVGCMGELIPRIEDTLK